MQLQTENLGGHMAVAIHGLDLRTAPSSDLSAALRQALWDHQIVCIRGQTLTPGQFQAVLSIFGEPQVRPEIPHVEGHPAVTTLSSEDRDAMGDGKRIVVGSHWHSDDTYWARPSAITALYGIEVPETGGDTQYANMYAAYEALPEEKRHALDRMKVVHMMVTNRKDVRGARTIAPEILAKRPPVMHPLVRTHPETGRKSLYVSRNRMDHIVGMDRDAGHRLIDELTDHAIQPQFTYRHKWRKGDVTIWDNRCLMHKANGDYPEGARRFMQRIIVEGEVPF